VATADQIIRRVLVRCGWPSSNAPLDNAEILELVDDEITSTLWPQLHAAQGDWHLARKDYTLVSGQALYRLPELVWGPIKELEYVDSSGRARDLTVVNVGELGRIGNDSRPLNGTPYYAYVDGDNIGLFPPPSGTEYALRVTYYREPSALCLESAARRINILTSNDELTLESTIATFDGADVDIIGKGGSHQVIGAELGVTSVVGTLLTFANAYTEPLGVGDWVSLSGTSPVAQIPNHMVPQLCDRVAMAALNSNGDQAGFNRNAAVAKEREARGVPTLEPRIEAEPAIITPHSSPWRS
jgi:hypothetical protein